MKFKFFSSPNPEFSQPQKPSQQCLWARQLARALCVAAMVLFVVTARGANTFWDANLIGGPSDGSGTWHGSNNWFSAGADQAWVDGNVAIIGTNVPGTYSIVLDTPVNLTTLQFRSNNYTLSGATLTMTAILVTNGATATINCPITTASGGITVGNAGANLTLGGGYSSSTGNPNYNGSSQTTSTINITNGTYTEAGTWTANGVTVNQTGGTVNFANVNIGRTIAATYSASGGILNGTASFIVSRSFPGILNVSGTAQVGGKTMAIAGVDNNDNGTVNVTGGKLNVGITATATPGTSSATLAPITLLAANVVYLAAAKAVLNISGGTVGAKGIQFGGSADDERQHQDQPA